MKNSLKSLALVAVSALAVVSCQKDELASQNDGEGVFFSLRTGDASKTYIVADGEGFKPQWANGDEIGVLFEELSVKTKADGVLTNSNASGSIAKFDGIIEGAPINGTLYAFYPSEFAKMYSSGSDVTIGFDIPAIQNPTATSFDSKADLLISKSVDFSADGSGVVAIDDVYFARALAILKINVYSQDFEVIQGQYLSKLTVTAVGGRLAGRPVFDLTKGDAKITKYNTDGESVSAEYEEDIVCVGSSKTSTGCSVFLMVAPVTLNKDAKLKFTGVTGGYTISKEVTLPSDIVLTPGKCTQINLSLAEENCEPIKEEADWKIVTDVEDLAEGDIILLGCAAKKAVNGGIGSNEYLASIGAEFSDDGSEITSCDGAMPIALGKDEDGNWTLTTVEGTIGATAAKKMSLTSGTRTWTISIVEDGTASIKSTDESCGTIKYNSGSPRFLNYASGQTEIQIYKFYGTREPLAAPANVQAAVDGEKANKLNVSWDAVDNAVAYEVVISGGDEDIVEKAEDNSLSVDGLDYEKTYSVKVKACSGDYIKYKDSDYSEAVDVTTGKKTGASWNLVTDVKDLEEGDMILLGYVTTDATKNRVNGGLGTTAYLAPIEATFSNGEIVSLGDGYMPITLGKDEDGNWTLTTDEGTIGATAEKSLSVTAATRTTTWTISIADKTATIASTNTNYGKIQYNTSSPRFVNYKSAQGSIQIYKYNDPRTVLPTPANLSVNGMTVSWDAVSGAGSYKVTVNGAETSVNTDSYVYTGAAGYYDVSVYAVPDETASATYKNSDAATLTKAKFGEPVLETPELSSNGVTASSVSAKWTVDPNASNGYLCQLYNGEDFVSDQTVSTGAVTFTNLTEDTEYTVKVQAKAVTEPYAYAASEVASIKLTPAGLHIKDITAEGTYNIGGLLVYAVSGSNAILGDNTGKILFYKSSHGLAVGDKVDVNGNVEEYNGVWEFKGAAISNKTTGNPVDHGTPVELSTISSYGTAPTITYVHATGTQDDSRNITTDGANSYKLYLSAESADNVGKPVDVTGYTHGYYASKSTVSFIALDIHLDGISVDPSSVTLGAESGSTAKVNVTSSVAWTANTSSDWTVSPASGNAGTTEVTITASKAGGDAEATLADLVFTQTGTSKSATVTVKQQKTGGVTWTRVTTIKELTDGGTFIMGYEATAKSGKIIPLRSKDCNAKTTANGYFNTGTTANSSTSGTIDMSKLTESADYEVYISSPVSGKINIQMKDENGSYYGATNGGTTKNTGRLYTSGNSDETNLTPAFSSEQDNQFKLTGDVSGSYKYLKYNTSSPRFAYYNSAGSNIVFYKKN